MFVNQSTEPSPDWPGLVFKFVDWTEAIPDSPSGIWIEGDLVSQDLVLRERTRSGVVYRFIALELSHRPASDAMTRPLHDMTSQSKPGYVTRISLFAEVVEDSASVFELIEQAIATKEDPPALLDTAQRIMTAGFDLSCEFINILCQEFDQYWLRMPDPSGWGYLLHYSKPRAKWCTLRLPDQLVSSLVQRRPSLVSRTGWHRHILLKMIRESDVERMRVAGPVAEPTFAEEMLATALVELRQDRIRSAILHAVIGYESAAKHGLDTLLKTRLKGLDLAKVLEAISREVSTETLGRVVLSHVEAVTDPPLDWDKITALYNTRNMIVHRGQRRMPPYKRVRDQVLEVRTYVRRLQAALQSSEPHRAIRSALR